ncbi:MAG: hypothetical protein MUC54_02565 [Chloroflexi bacterium]|nr:hypothetical protein [Chloroflexota bacterium]
MTGDARPGGTAPGAGREPDRTEPAAAEQAAAERSTTVGGTGRSFAARFDDTAVAALLFLAALLVYWLVKQGRPTGLDYFVPLADAFLHGRTWLIDPPSNLNELVPLDGHWYVVYPPLPAILLVPLVALFGPAFDQAALAMVLGALNVVLAWRAVLGLGVGRRTALVLAVVWGFGSITWYSAQEGSAWHIAHVVSLTCAFLAILGAQRNVHPVLVGLAVGAMAMARLPMLLAAPFFLAWLADRAAREAAGAPVVAFGSAEGGAEPWGRRRPVPLDRFARLAIPFAVGLAVPLLGYLAYNAVRFGSPAETGYTLIPGLMDEWQYRNGMFAISSVPRKLYAMFLSVPAEVGGFPWVLPRHLGGLSIVLTTPLFLWAIAARRPDWFGIGAWTAVALVLVPVLLHADPGGEQFGFRYAQDIYPFLFLLTARALRPRITFEAWVAIGIGLLVNAWGMAVTAFDRWA